MKWIGWFGLERVCRGLLTSEASIEVKLVGNRVATRVPNACLASPAIRRISECERGPCCAGKLKDNRACGKWNADKSFS